MAFFSTQNRCFGVVYPHFDRVIWFLFLVFLLYHLFFLLLISLELGGYIIFVLVFVEGSCSIEGTIFSSLSGISELRESFSDALLFFGEAVILDQAKLCELRMQELPDDLGLNLQATLPEEDRVPHNLLVIVELLLIIYPFVMSEVLNQLAPEVS